MIWLLIGYIWLFVHRPFEVWPVLGDMRLELIYVLGMTAVWAIGIRKQLTGNPLNVALLAFACAVLLCALASSHSDYCWKTVENYFKLLAFYLFVVTVIRDERALSLLLLGFMAATTLFMLHSLWEFHNGRFVYRMGIRRMIGVGISSADPNAFAAGLVLALPFVPVLWREYTHRYIRICLAGSTALIVLCVLLTGSRGGLMLGLIAAALCIWTSRWRKHLALAAVAIGPLLFVALPGELQTRFETIVNPDAGPKNAQTSADARTEGLMTGLELWASHPLTGVGPGAWRPATGRLLESHNLYGQLPGELGTLGVLTFGAFVIAFIGTILHIRSAYRGVAPEERDFLFDLGRALAITLFLLLMQGNFGHNLFRYNWVWFAAFAVAARQCLAQRQQAWWTPHAHETYETHDGWTDDGSDHGREMAGAWHGQAF